MAFVVPKKILIISHLITANQQSGADFPGLDHTSEVSQACMQEDICWWHVILWNQLMQAVSVTSVFGTNSSRNFRASPRFMTHHDGAPVFVEVALIELSGLNLYSLLLIWYSIYLEKKSLGEMSLREGLVPIPVVSAGISLYYAWGPGEVDESYWEGREVRNRRGWSVGLRAAPPLLKQE